MTVTSKLPPLESPGQTTWLETTTLDHGHGGNDFWGFGQALWSPSRDAGGKEDPDPCFTPGSTPGLGPDSESTSIAGDRALHSPEKDVTSFVTR